MGDLHRFLRKIGLRYEKGQKSLARLDPLLLSINRRASFFHKVRIAHYTA